MGFRNLLCGMLHCKHLNERLEFGMESVAILSHSFINNGGKIIPCRSAIVDLGLNQVDPGLAPDGAKCAPGKVSENKTDDTVDCSDSRDSCPPRVYFTASFADADVRESEVHAGSRFARVRVWRESVSQ